MRDDALSDIGWNWEAAEMRAHSPAQIMIAPMGQGRSEDLGRDVVEPHLGLTEAGNRSAPTRCGKDEGTAETG
jgi:hypothetical protein